MPYCAKCGTEAAGNFCPACGSPIAAPAGGATGAQGPAASQPPGAPPPPLAASSALDPNVASALCYLAGLVTGILFLVLEPYSRDKTVRFHAFQSIFANLAMIAGWIILTILAYMPFIGLLFTFMIVFAYPLATIALWIILMYKAYNRERLVLPIIGPLAEKQA